MVLCFKYTKKSEEQLRNELDIMISHFVESKYYTREYLIPSEVYEMCKEIMNKYEVNHEIIKKDLEIGTFSEPGPEDVHPPFYYNYERPFIMLNGKQYKLTKYTDCKDKFYEEKIVMRLTPRTLDYN
jgi:hypothetical protein